MAEITGYTAARMKQIEDNSIVDGDVNGSGHLILKKYNNATIDAGSVIGPTGNTGAKGDTGEVPEAPNTGLAYARNGATGLWVPVTQEMMDHLGAIIVKRQAVVSGGPVGGATVTLATIDVPAVLVDSYLECSAFWSAYWNDSDSQFNFEIQVNGVMKGRVSMGYATGVHERKEFCIPTTTFVTLTTGNGATVTVKAVRSSGQSTLTQETAGVATATTYPV